MTTTAMNEPLDLREVHTLGADLDLTLLDTRAATAHALREVNSACGASIDIEEFLARMGPPIHEALARWISVEGIDEAVGVYRSTFVKTGLVHLSLLPGATDLAAELRSRTGQLVVITSRLPAIASACLLTVGLRADIVVGGLTGVEKAAAMREHHVDVYVGDHPLDMEGAVAAGIPGIGITTGGHDAHRLRAAGAAWVVSGLSEIVAAMR